MCHYIRDVTIRDTLCSHVSSIGDVTNEDADDVTIGVTLYSHVSATGDVTIEDTDDVTSVSLHR